MNRFRPNIKKNFLMIGFIISILILLNVFLENFVVNKEQSNSQINIGGNFSLIDSDNNVFNSINITKNKLIYFGYTYCPDVCPIDLNILSILYSENKELVNYIQPIFISIDPQRDKPNVLKNFLSNFDSSIIGLTGSSEEISNVQKKFRIYKNVVEDPSEEDFYTIDHTSIFYLVDKNDLYIKHFSRKDFDKEFTSYLLNEGLI